MSRHFQPKSANWRPRKNKVDLINSVNYTEWRTARSWATVSPFRTVNWPCRHFRPGMVVTYQTVRSTANIPTNGMDLSNKHMWICTDIYKNFNNPRKTFVCMTARLWNTYYIQKPLGTLKGINWSSRSIKYKAPTTPGFGWRSIIFSNRREETNPWSASG